LELFTPSPLARVVLVALEMQVALMEVLVLTQSLAQSHQQVVVTVHGINK
jgi:hypothetical protein